MNPLLRLLPALYTRLSGLTQAGQDVPVFQHLDTPRAGHYVLLEQATAPRAPGTQGCRQWSCTVLLNIVTQFPKQGRVSAIPANELADQVTTLLDDCRLLLPDYDCGPGRLELSTELREQGPESIAVRRLLRYRWTISYHL